MISKNWEINMYSLSGSVIITIVKPNNNQLIKGKYHDA